MQRGIFVKVECALYICLLDVLCRGSAKNKDIPFICTKDISWDEEKLLMSHLDNLSFHMRWNHD